MASLPWYSSDADVDFLGGQNRAQSYTIASDDIDGLLRLQRKSDGLRLCALVAEPISSEDSLFSPLIRRIYLVSFSVRQASSCNQRNWSEKQPTNNP